MRQTNRNVVLGAAMVANFLAAMEVTIVGTAMPTIVGVLQGFQLYSWVVTGYLLAQTITTPIYGKLADLYGRKRTFLIGALIFLTGSMLCGLATSMPFLIAARVVQGLGGGAIMPVTVTLIGDLFPGKERGKAQGMVASVWGIASVLGPLIGVFIVSTLDWRWIFLINLPVGIAAMAALWFSLYEDVKPNPHGLDVPGAALLAGSVGLLLYGLRLAENALTKPKTLAIIGVGIALLVWFIRHERRAPEPLVPLSLFENRSFTVATSTGFLFGFPLTVITVMLPLFVQGALGGTPGDSGKVLMAMSVIWSLMSYVAGRWFFPRFGTRLPALIGLGVIVVGSAFLAMLNQHSSMLQLVLTSAVIGAGFGVQISGFVITVQESVGWNLRGVATSGVQFSRNLGTAVAAAVLGSVVNSILLPRLDQVESLAHLSSLEKLDLVNDALSEGGLGGLAAMSPELPGVMQGALAAGLQTAFLVSVAASVIGLTVALFVRSRSALTRGGAGGGQ